MQNRDKIIDLFKTIGLLAIILAHVSAPAVIVQLRNFDVVLMVLLTGVSYSLSASKPKTKNQYILYVYRRFKRLIISAWLFLFVFFSLTSILNRLDLVSLHYSIVDYVDSFLLLSGQPNTNGIGFMWIMRIYFLTALMLPFTEKISKKVSKRQFFCGIITILILYTLLLKVPISANSIFAKIFENILLYMIGYGLVASIGLVICDLTKKEYCAGLIISFVIFVIQVFTVRNYTQIAKYPPHIYYFSYAFTMIFLLFYFRDAAVIEYLSEKTIIQWIAKNSLWIYYMHIIPIKLYECGIIQLYWDNFIIRYFFVLTIACLLVFTKNIIAHLTRERRR